MLTGQGILDVWERAQGRGPAAAALVLLAAATPGASWEALGALPVGERDRRLLALREQTLGPRLDAFARCPACGEALDLALDAAALATGSGGQPPAELSLEGLRFRLRFRLPNGLDLLAAESCLDVEDARRLLAERCLLEPEGHELTEAQIAAMAAAMTEADPGAELLLDLQCPACGQAWQEPFDVATFFRAELDVQARRLLREVHALARAYGWREPEILALTPRRRRVYLEMLGS
jgi:hypothetical protein